MKTNLKVSSREILARIIQEILNKLKKMLSLMNKKMTANKSQKMLKICKNVKRSKYCIPKLNLFLHRDYRAMPELDAYEAEGIDEAPQ